MVYLLEYTKTQTNAYDLLNCKKSKIKIIIIIHKTQNIFD